MFTQIVTLVCAAAMTLSLYMEASHFLQRGKTSITSDAAPAPASARDPDAPPPPPR